MYISGIEPDEVSEEDKIELDRLGFFVGEESDDGFMSYKFGSS
jgi:hypothetical protein